MSSKHDGFNNDMAEIIAKCIEELANINSMYMAAHSMHNNTLKGEFRARAYEQVDIMLAKSEKLVNGVIREHNKKGGDNEKGS